MLGVKLKVFEYTTTVGLSQPNGKRNDALPEKKLRSENYRANDPVV